MNHNQALTPVGPEMAEYQMAGAPAALFRASDPAGIVAQATAVAAALAPVIDQQKLYTDISGRRHVRVEGWSLLGTMLGVFPVCAWSRPITYQGETGGNVIGWEARVEARTLAGALVGAAEAQCTRDEPTWGGRPDYALRSMAQTRATSKALRLPLGFVVTLAGYDATPAEEMDGIEASAHPAQRQPPRNRPPAPSGTQGNGRPENRPLLLATEPQIKAIYAIARGPGAMDGAEVEARCREIYGVAIEALTRKQASEFIEALQGRA